MYQSNRSFNWSIPRATPGNPPGIWTFEDWLVQIPSLGAKKPVQMNHQLVFKYVYSKTNFVFDQTLFTLFRERCAVMTPSDFFWSPFSKELFTDKGEILSEYRKTSQEYYARTRDKSDSNFPLFQGNVQIPPFLGTMQRQMPGVCRGGGGWMFKLQFDRSLYLRETSVRRKQKHKDEKVSFFLCLHSLVYVKPIPTGWEQRVSLFWSCSC